MITFKPAAERKSNTLIIGLDGSTRKAVERIARREGCTLSEIGRRALSQFIQGNKKSSPSGTSR